jgi:hypothetical protein
MHVSLLCTVERDEVLMRQRLYIYVASAKRKMTEIPIYEKLDQGLLIAHGNKPK